MQAVILVGGEGTRLRPLTYDLPKPMVPIFGKPYLEHLFDLLKKHNIYEIILSSGYKVEEIQKHFKDGSDFGVKIYYAVETTPLGTAGAVKNAERFITGTFLAFNGDIISDIDLTALIEFHRNNKSMATISLYWVEDPSQYGLVETDQSDRILEFKEKPKKEEAVSNYINAGIYVLEKEVLSNIPENEKYSFERQLYPDLLSSGKHLYGFKYNSYWIDIGSPEKYLKIHQDALKGKYELELPIKGHNGIYLGKNINIDSAKLTPPVYIEDNCKLEDDLAIGPDVIIGKNCIIKNNSTISNSLFWENVIIGNNTVISGSILGRNLTIENNKNIIDEILGSSINV